MWSNANSFLSVIDYMYLNCDFLRLYFVICFMRYLVHVLNLRAYLRKKL